MAGVVICTVVLGLAGLAAWRVLRRPKGDFCSICSCGSCPGHCGKCSGECCKQDGKQGTQGV